MHLEPPQPGKTPRTAKTGQRAPKSQRHWTILLVLITVACAWGVWKKSRQPEPSAAAPPPTEAGQEKKTAPMAARAEAPAVEPVEASPAPSPVAPNTGTVRVAPERTVPSAQPAPPRQEPSPYTRQLVAGLTQLDLRSGIMTPEQATQWKQGLQAVVQQGAAAVPAIRELLERKQDLNFAGLQDGGLAGYPSLRTGLIGALQQIGGAEALDLSVQTLRGATDPLEIALLARNIEQQAPGQYRQDAISAARVALDQAARDQQNTLDVGPLFQMLQAYADPGVLAELQNGGRWNYYATLALAGLPDGQGIPTLMREAQDPATSSGNRSLSLQLLAQASGQYPEAAATLVEQARLNQIPDTTWRQIGWALGGDQYQFGSQFVDGNLPPAMGSGVRTFHIEAGNQNYYTTPILASLSPDQINQRRALIDQLLAVTTSPVAVQGLQAARAMLSGGQAQR